MVLTRMAWGDHSAARDFARWDTAALEALCFGGRGGGLGLVDECEGSFEWGTFGLRKGKERKGKERSEDA